MFAGQAEPKGVLQLAAIAIATFGISGSPTLSHLHFLNPAFSLSLLCTHATNANPVAHLREEKRGRGDEHRRALSHAAQHVP